MSKGKYDFTVKQMNVIDAVGSVIEGSMAVLQYGSNDKDRSLFFKYRPDSIPDKELTVFVPDEVWNRCTAASIAGMVVNKFKSLTISLVFDEGQLFEVLHAAEKGRCQPTDLLQSMVTGRVDDIVEPGLHNFLKVYFSNND